MAGDLIEDQWKEKLKEKLPQYFDGVRVLDIGSADINGNNRGLYSNSEYIGLDLLPWKNVDVISIAHEYQTEPESFDSVISTNTFEHDKHWQKTLKKMVELLKSDGLMWFTCGYKYPEHGTKRANPSDSLTTQLDDEEWTNYYRNLTIKDIKDVLDLDKIFKEYKIFYKNNNLHLFFWGIKK